jgi:hypothetical protein
MQSSVIYKNPVRTSEETHYISATETNRLMLFRETVSVYCENQNAEFQCVKAGGTYSNHWSLEDNSRWSFMGPKGSFSCSQGRVTRTDPESDESTPWSHLFP